MHRLVFSFLIMQTLCFSGVILSASLDVISPPSALHQNPLSVSEVQLISWIIDGEISEATGHLLQSTDILRPTRRLVVNLNSQFKTLPFPQQKNVLKFYHTLLGRQTLERTVTLAINDLYSDALFDALVNDLVHDPQALNVMKKVIEFYEGNPGTEHMEKSRKVAPIIAGFPYVQMVYGVGFPYYGYSDIRRVLLFNVLKLLKGELSEMDLVRYSLPDFDYLLVVHYFDPEEVPNTMKDNFDQILKENYISSLKGFWPQVNRLLKKLSDTGLIANFDLDSIEEFLEGRFYPDRIYFPSNIWEHIPLLIEESDKMQFKWIRDVEFSAEFIFGKSGSEKIVNTNVPVLFKRNKILSLLKTPMTKAELEIAIVDSMTHRRQMMVLKDAALIVMKKWDVALEDALEHHLVQFSNGRYRLTSLGRRHLQYVKSTREKILSHLTQLNVYAPYFAPEMMPSESETPLAA